MESQEQALESHRPASLRSVFGEGGVDLGTVSTADPVPQNDDSVISAVTDPASLEEQTTHEIHIHASVDDVEGQQMKMGVPDQVILPDDSSGSSGGSPNSVSPSPDEEEVPVAGTEASYIGPSSSLPDPPASLNGDGESQGSHGVAGEAVSATPTNELNDSLDAYIRSPEIQNAIVERSPGERYVRFMEKLGSGASKDVYRAYDTQEGIEVAWNVVNLSGVPKNERNRIVNEVRLLERLHHPNIISFHGSWVNRERQEVNFVTEILSSGTLKSFINKVQVIRWKIAKRWAVQILNGLEYLHSQEPPVIHRDLKCDNIFINGTSGDLRIGDLGLSTVHRHGRVLSVLGTPEFMAPDMYEDTSYDEKVDIYAFGMCVLEIFTKEIPYSECSNPAQIYKKVSSGEPPEVLSRLQSKHARDFILLCLGYRDENDKFIRPSASELLKHPFLEKRASDDDEVVVARPLRERPITEARDRPVRERAVVEPQETLSSTAVTSSSRAVSSRAVSIHEGSSTGEFPPVDPLPTRVDPPRTRDRLNSIVDEDDGDQFDRMPESETNMKKVKVLMGRDTELEDEEDKTNYPKHPGIHAQSGGIVAAAESESDSGSRGHAMPSDQGRELSVADSPAASGEKSQHSPTQLLVAAAVIENENPIVRPYADDILKLVVTLPVDGQTQNVQFDFHLVEDDPVQVAKEMVRELNIPQGAVLEISETISGLACAARMKQDKYAVSMQQPHVHQNGLVPQSHHRSPELSSASPAIELPGLPWPQLPVQHLTSEQNLLMQGSQVPQQQTYPQPQAGSGGAPVAVSGESLQQQVQLCPEPHHIQVHLQQNTYPTSTLSTSTHSQSGLPPAGLPEVSAPVSTSAQAVALQQIQPQAPAWAAQSSARNEVPMHPAAQRDPSPSGRYYVDPSERSAFEQSIVENSPSHRRETQPGDNRVRSSSFDFPPLVHRYHSGGLTPQKQENKKAGSSTSTLSLVGDELDNEHDEDVNDEIRQLDLDFQKNLQRAKKVFYSRMENLQRSQIEREAQHQKTLEKHQKERAEFEKRLAQEEELQNRRIEQLQREWDRKREDLALQKSMPHRHSTTPNGVHDSVDSISEGPTPAVPMHMRNPSNASSALSMSPMTFDRKLSKDTNGDLES